MLIFLFLCVGVLCLVWGLLKLFILGVYIFPWWLNGLLFGTLVTLVIHFFMQ